MSGELQPQLTAEAARREWTETLRVTKSQLTTYVMCPRKYFLQYVQDTPAEFTPVALVFGKVLHAVVADYYIALKDTGVAPPLADVLEEFNISWMSACLLEEPAIQFDEKHTRDGMAALGVLLLTAFVADVRPRTIEAVEYPFAVDLVHPDTGEILDIKLVGIIDLVESDEDGNKIVVELKTASQRMSDAKAEDLLDGLVYAYAFDQLGHRTTENETLVRIDVLVKTKTPTFQQVFVNQDRAGGRRLVRWIVQILASIEAGAFHATPGWVCKGCQFRTACEEGMRA